MTETPAPRPNYLRPTNADASSVAPFWSGLQDRELRGQRCTACATLFFPPRPVCPECARAPLEWVELSGRGSLHSWTLVKRAGPRFDVPMIIGLIDLSEGVGRLVAKMEVADPSTLVIGAEVELGYRDTPDGFTVFFARLTGDAAE